ncbi:DNA sulfur modification protein DndE [Undibacterium sp. TJN19]|uniref:DNA sulfur modification protein DndE n=1 Tax=Undibacterium sp. TJN19 TaxID=3413055 RepID=UPI003BF35951
MIDRLRISAAGKNQLISLKRKTGIEHYNVLCRYALCLSLANPSSPPNENYNYSGGIDIDWRTLTGGNEALYTNLLLLRISNDNVLINEEGLRQILASHIHRGLSYLSSRNDRDLLLGLAGKF